MADRERKRAELRKRKRRSVEQVGEPGVSGDDQATRRAAAAERSEAKNEAAREQLEPLAPGQRPTVVTVGALISALIAISAIVGYIAGVKVTRIGSDGIEQGEHGAPILSVLAAVALMGTMAWGMWRARYWAVLGFQALLVIVLVAASLGLVQATSWLQAAGTTLLIVGAAALFYFMIKAMARIQMPERRAPD
jgi:preprotein translocase subunit YajC